MRLPPETLFLSYSRQRNHAFQSDVIVKNSPAQRRLLTSTLPRCSSQQLIPRIPIVILCELEFHLLVYNHSQLSNILTSALENTHTHSRTLCVTVLFHSVPKFASDIPLRFHSLPGSLSSMSSCNSVLFTLCFFKQALTYVAEGLQYYKAITYILHLYFTMPLTGYIENPTKESKSHISHLLFSKIAFISSAVLQFSQNLLALKSRLKARFEPADTSSYATMETTLVLQNYLTSKSSFQIPTRINISSEFVFYLSF